MHVLFVGPFPWPSHQGSQVYLAGQARALVERGHRVTLAVYGVGQGGEIPGVTLLRARRVPLAKPFAGGLSVSRPLADIALARAVRRYCRTQAVDVLHAHNVEGPLVARLARTGLPVVYDLHTEMREELASHLPPPFRALGPPVGALFDRLAVRVSDAGCAISERARAHLEAGGLPTVTVGHALHPDDLHVRPGAHERLRLPPRFVVYTGNLDGYQDLPLLYRAMEGVGVPLVVVTGSHAPLPEGVIAVRSASFRDAMDVLAVADVAVIPRRQCTGLPVKLLNQLGVGCPTVMMRSAAVDLPGVVTATPDTLEDVLRGLLADPARLRTLGEAGRAAVLAEWTWDVRAERLEALYALLRG
ncbi:MAG: glycosyltransferase family 4 protein [Myxococcales bacterium]|nr:glycosyltransferase family 4 protein [Myxococcales bacterium]